MYCSVWLNYQIRLSCHHLTTGNQIYESSRNFPCYFVFLNVINTVKLSLYNLAFLSNTQKRFTYILVIFLGTEMPLYIFQHRNSWAFQKCPPFLSRTIRKMTICRKLCGACFVGHPVLCFMFLSCLQPPIF